MLNEALLRHRRYIVAGASGDKICRKSFRIKVPKRGLEPPLPLREPGPEPGFQSFQARWNGIGIVLETPEISCNTDIPHRSHIVSAWVPHGQFCPPNAPQNYYLWRSSSEVTAHIVHEESVERLRKEAARNKTLGANAADRRSCRVKHTIRSRARPG